MILLHKNLPCVYSVSYYFKAVKPLVRLKMLCHKKLFRLVIKGGSFSMKKSISALLVSASLVFALSGCSGSSSTSSKDANGKTEITVFTWGFPAEKTAREAQAKLFNQTHKDVEVKITVSPDYDRKLDALIAGKNAPDVFETSSDWYHIRMDLGQLVDLNPYVKKDNLDLNQYYPRMINDFKTFDGTKLESMPIGMATFAMAINEDLFKKNGVTIPDPEKGWTWDEALQAAQKITSGSGTEKIYGMSDHWMYQQLAGYFYGGTYTDPKFTKIEVNSPEAIKGIQFASDLMYKYHVMPDATAAKGLASAQRFYAGKSGMVPVNNWDIPDVGSNIGNKFNWEIVPMPTMTETGKAPTWYITEGYGISTQSKHKDAAWEFVKWVTTDPEALKLASNAAIPSTKDAATSFINLGKVGDKELNLKPYLSAIDNAVPSPFGGIFAKMGSELTNFWQALDTNKAYQKDVTKGVQDLSKKLQADLDATHASK
jgi:multiple sugar transport system substrate-binding protein